MTSKKILSAADSAGMQTLLTYGSPKISAELEEKLKIKLGV